MNWDSPLTDGLTWIGTWALALMAALILMLLSLGAIRLAILNWKYAAMILGLVVFTFLLALNDEE